jgi:hypothetical protein
MRFQPSIPHQLLADPGGHGRSLKNKKGHVGAESRTHVHQLSLREWNPKVLIQAQQNAGGVAAAATEAGTDRNPLVEDDSNGGSPIQTVKENLGGTNRQVIFMLRKNGIVTLKLNRRNAKFQGDLVVQIHGAHQGEQVVVSILSLSGNRQEEIYFGRRQDLHGRQED